MDVLFQLSAVQKRYGATLALDLPQLAFRRGHLYLLTGPNGSGKSTLLSILALLARPDRGEVVLAGERVTWTHSNLNRLRKKVTLLHQSPYLFHGTVFHNVSFGLRMRGMKREEQREIVADALAMVGLAGFGERNAGELSGGEARRVAMARALACRPDVLLLDEPLANVDQASGEVLERLVATLPAKGTTIIISTHDLQQAERLECEVIALNSGRLEQAHNQYTSARKGVEHAQL